jgi:hypothetical protein
LEETIKKRRRRELLTCASLSSKHSDPNAEDGGGNRTPAYEIRILTHLILRIQNQIQIQGQIVLGFKNRNRQHCTGSNNLVGMESDVKTPYKGSTRLMVCLVMLLPLNTIFWLQKQEIRNGQGSPPDRLGI